MSKDKYVHVVTNGIDNRLSCFLDEEQLEKYDIVNAVIEEAVIEINDRGWLGLSIECDKGGGHQAFVVNFCCPKNPFDKHHLQILEAQNAKNVNYLGKSIRRILTTLKVSDWERLKGKPVRLAIDSKNLSGFIRGIGHYISDQWFFPMYELNEDNHI